MASGMEMMFTSAINAFIARLPETDLAKFKETLNWASALKSQVDRIEANQIMIMRALGIDISANSGANANGPTDQITGPGVNAGSNVHRASNGNAGTG